MIAATYARKSTDQTGVADEQKLDHREDRPNSVGLVLSGPLGTAGRGVGSMTMWALIKFVIGLPSICYP
jgi:hypothetical protein